MYGISSIRYKQIITSPVVAWHGANLAVRSILIDTTEQESVYDSDFLENLNNGDYQKKLEKVNTSSTKLSRNEMKNLLAANRMRDERLTKDKSRLEKTNQQLLNSKSTLDSLNQDFSNIEMYKQQELARKEAFEEAASYSSEAPTEADARAVMEQRNVTTNQPVKGIPQKVLSNVQQTTGISPEEINALMNQ